MRVWQAVVLGAALFGAIAVAERNTDFATDMRAVNSASNLLRKYDVKGTDPKAKERAMEAVERIGSVYEDMISLWRRREAVKGVQWATQGKAASAELATAIYAGDAEKSAAALSTLNGTCNGCHAAYRERAPEGGYRFKYKVEPLPQPKPAVAK